MMTSVLVGVGVLSWAVTAAVRVRALRTGMLDRPNARSSHAVATPRGGGIAIVVSMLAALPLVYALTDLSAETLLVLAAAGAGVAAIGWADDHADVSARWRLLVQVLAAAIVLVFIGGMPALEVGGVAWQAGWPGAIFLLLMTVWLINLYNFMDGVDGLAAGEAVTVGAWAALLLGWQGAHGLALIAAILCAASLGFLAWNWPPARIFLGDAGSGFLGFMFAALLLVSWADGSLEPLAWLILLGAFIVDATVTLLRRLITGARVYQAHRTHAYQKAARRLGRHRPVSLAVILINLFWLGPMALAAVAHPAFGWLLLAIGWLPLLAAACFLRAGVAE